jgi:O-antigen/teichoic acid export membrane protein
MFPEKLLLAAVGMVALPELSRQSREGGDLKKSYLKALSNITAVHWPFMAMLALLAQPVVLLVLGQQWRESAPLVSIISPALMMAVPIILQFPALVAANGVQLLPRLLVLQVIVTTTALSVTAPYGLHAAALSMLVAIPLNASASLLAVRSKIGFHLGELIAALLPSAITTLATVAGPFLFSLTFQTELSLPVAVAAAAMGGVGWITALYATEHPLWRELIQAGSAVAGSPFFRRLRSSQG